MHNIRLLSQVALEALMPIKDAATDCRLSSAYTDRNDDGNDAGVNNDELMLVRMEPTKL